MSEIELLASAVSEYRGLLPSDKDTPVDTHDMGQLIHNLVQEHDWTEGGARAIVTLANEYGAFMLRHAFALAIVLDKEDGDLGY